MVVRRRSIFVLALLLAVLVTGGAPARGRTSGMDVDGPMLAGAIRAPDGYVAPRRVLPDVGASSGHVDGLRAVAIVGEVGTSTATYKQDMSYAVAALEAHGVTVASFLYGDSSFTWADIVAAADDAHFLLYMGHGVYWGGTCTDPTSVGGFYLGPDRFVSPEAVRTDLAGRLADDAVVIFSHACYTAGSTACDSVGVPDVAEAQRRVTLYAQPFVELGLQAYFANNYFHSAESIVNRILEDASARDSVGGIFLSTYPNQPANHRDLSYPVGGYDLWLNGTPGNWDHAFVGQPGYVFSGDLREPELGGLPTSVGFLYSIPDATLTPLTVTIVPANIGTDDALVWTATETSAWFDVTPESGTTPTSFNVVPGSLLSLPEGSYAGVITVTVTAPEETQATPQTVNVSLRVTERSLSYVFLPLVGKGP